MERIIQEKISADHLLYVSLKYTKTTDIMLNLLERWKSMIDFSIDKLLDKARKQKKISSVPSIPKIKIDKAKDIYKKNKEVIDAIWLYEFFKRVPRAEKMRENEFRKNVTLKILDAGDWVNIDIEKLKEYNVTLEKFISSLKQIV